MTPELCFVFYKDSVKKLRNIQTKGNQQAAPTKFLMYELWDNFKTKILEYMTVNLPIVLKFDQFKQLETEVTSEIVT